MARFNCSRDASTAARTVSTAAVTFPGNKMTPEELEIDMKDFLSNRASPVLALPSTTPKPSSPPLSALSTPLHHSPPLPTPVPPLCTPFTSICSPVSPLSAPSAPCPLPPLHTSLTLVLGPSPPLCTPFQPLSTTLHGNYRTSPARSPFHPRSPLFITPPHPFPPPFCPPPFPTPFRRSAPHSQHLQDMFLSHGLTLEDIKLEMLSVVQLFANLVSLSLPSTLCSPPLSTPLHPFPLLSGTFHHSHSQHLQDMFLSHGLTLEDIKLEMLSVVQLFATLVSPVRTGAKNKPKLLTIIATSEPWNRPHAMEKRLVAAAVTGPVPGLPPELAAAAAAQVRVGEEEVRRTTSSFLCSRSYTSRPASVQEVGADAARAASFLFNPLPPPP
ncbi:unnamed protein product [Closterium sp. NIES-64]|nr:unnamed protein product [Closterium sp. NIES-64]